MRYMMLVYTKEQEGVSREELMEVAAGHYAVMEEAKRRGEDGFKFFGYALAHHYIFGEHTPGRTDIWAAYEKARPKLPEAFGSRWGLRRARSGPSGPVRP